VLQEEQKEIEEALSRGRRMQFFFPCDSWFQKEVVPDSNFFNIPTTPVLSYPSKMPVTNQVCSNTTEPPSQVSISPLLSF
jgi:hypothetical protein